jgi:hypothetical protein
MDSPTPLTFLNQCDVVSCCQCLALALEAKKVAEDPLRGGVCYLEHLTRQR